MPKTTWTCLGQAEALEEIAHAAGTDGHLGGWTINRRAVTGDAVVFYLAGRSEFVAVGELWEDPERMDPDHPRAGKHMAHVGDVVMLPERVHQHAAIERFPGWGWVRMPIQSSKVPPEAAAFFATTAAPDRAEETQAGPLDAEPGSGSGSGSGSADPASALEGERREVLHRVRSRSERLRRQALEAAGGICACCGTDFGEVLSGLGLRALQVHHTRPLGERDGEEETRAGELAVVCANCHCMLHAGPVATPVAGLQQCWERARTGRSADRR